MIETYRKSGVEIRIGDLKDSVEKLTEALAGVDVFISAVVAWLIEDQKVAIRAAKAAGVKRFIPCDFATPGERGIRELHDQVSYFASRERIASFSALWCHHGLTLYTHI